MVDTTIIFLFIQLIYDQSKYVDFAFDNIRAGDNPVDLATRKELKFT